MPREEESVDFFENLGKKITQTGQDAVKKTKDMGETVKLNSRIAEENRHIESCMAQIGEVYMEKYASDPQDELKPLVEEIRKSQEKVKSLKERILVLKGAALCASCGAAVPEDSIFCSTCGAKMPETVTAEAASIQTCPDCGAQVEEGARFCTSCGKAVKG